MRRDTKFLFERSTRDSEGHANVSEHFSKFSEDSRRLPKTSDEDPN